MAQTPEADRAKKEDISFSDFGGVNTQAHRTAIGDNEFSWLENAMPVDFGNMRTVPAPKLKATIVLA